MSDGYVISQCAPTLAGIKTGTVFPYVCEDIELLRNDIRIFNKKFSKKGLRLIPLSKKGNKTLLYMYRESALKQDLENENVQEILEDNGYTCRNCGTCVAKLVNRMRNNAVMPHEIGVFLSYPACDVKGFIDNKAKNYKYSGLWKVYGDVEKTKKIFEDYKNCKRSYVERYENGASLYELAI